jgi:hypothetical protein
MLLSISTAAYFGSFSWRLLAVKMLLHLFVRVVKSQSGNCRSVSRQHETPAPFTIRPEICPDQSRHVGVAPVGAIDYTVIP